MDKFAYLKYTETKKDIPINSIFINILPQYFKDKYIIKKNPLIINEIGYLDIEGYEIKLPLLEFETNTLKIETVIKKTVTELEQMGVVIATTDIKLCELYTQIIFINGKHLLNFFIAQALKRVLKFIQKDIKYIEILVIDSQDNYSTYNLINSIYTEINYLTLYTKRTEYFKNYIDKINLDTGLNLQIIEQNKSALKDADIIINLCNDDKINFDYFYKKGAVYFELSNNYNKALELLRKRQDINIIDDLIINCDTKHIKNNILEMVLYIKYSEFRDFINVDSFINNINLSSNIIEQNNLNIVGFCQYGNIIKQYNS